MDKRIQNRVVLLLSLFLGVVIIIISVTGLFVPDFYSLETPNWQAQSLGQDLVDLVLIVPCLLITSLLTYRGSTTAKSVWGGVVLYLTYTFVLYCFDVHFNKLFLLYCLGLGLSFYSFVFFIGTNQFENVKPGFENKPVVRVTGIYFLVVSVLFYLLWLSDIIPSILQNTVPESLAEAGLVTNGVHVLELAIFLPAIFITGIFLLRKMAAGFLIAPVLLTFFVLMDITIGALAVVMKMKGIESNLALTAVMALLALFSLLLLIWYYRSMKQMLSCENISENLHLPAAAL